MYIKSIGAILLSTILVGGAVSPAYAGGDCASKATAYEKEVEADMSMANARQVNVLRLVAKAKKLGGMGKKKGCEKLLKRAKAVADG